MRTVTVNPGAIFAGDGTEPFSWAHLIWLVASGRLAANLPGGACVVGERDVTAGVMAAWRRGTPGRRYVLGSANVSYRELFAEVARQTGRPPLRLTAPPLVLQACGAVNSLRNRLAGDPLHAGPLNLENAGLLARRLYYRWDLAERELGFRPGPLGQLVSDVLSAMSESRRSRPDRDLPDVGRQAACRSRRSRTSRITRS